MNKQRKKSKIQELRLIAKAEAVKGLEEHPEFCIVRPTGFGKTGILTDIAKNYIAKGKKVLYLYPDDVIRQAVLDFYYGYGTTADTIENLTFMTYLGLVLMKTKDMAELPQYDLIICDEAHKLGAYNTLISLYDLLYIQGYDYKDVHASKVKLLGATASPERADGIDELSIFFKDHISTPYTLHDAISKDHIIKAPVYIYCTYDKTDITATKKSAEAEIKKMHDPAAEAKSRELLASRLIEISNLQKMDHVIKTTCEKNLADQSYMKFITFFASFEHLHEKSKEVIKWFKSAYPNHKIRTLEITSENQTTQANVTRLKEFTHQDNTIDLILTCNMMNMGHHAADLTGVVFYRGTHSGIIYNQQLGRVLNTNEDAMPGLVFDVVDNLHRKAIYMTYDHSHQNRIIDHNGLIIDPITNKITLTGDGPEPVKDSNGNDIIIDRNDGHNDVFGPYSEPENLGIDITPIDSDDEDADDPENKSTDTTTSDATSNPIPKLELIMTDLNKKLSRLDENNPDDAQEIARIQHTLESLATSKQTDDKHEWTKAMNILYSEDLITEGHTATMRELMRKTVAEQVVQRCKLAVALWEKHGGQPIPLTRANWLGHTGINIEGTGTPLGPFAKLKQVTVEQILDVMGIKD